MNKDIKEFFLVMLLACLIVGVISFGIWFLFKDIPQETYPRKWSEREIRVMVVQEINKAKEPK